MQRAVDQNNVCLEPQRRQTYSEGSQGAPPCFRLPGSGAAALVQAVVLHVLAEMGFGGVFDLGVAGVNILPPFTAPGGGVSFSYSYGGSTTAVAERSLIREKIKDLERSLIDAGSITPDEADAKYVEHFYAPNTYARKMVIPAGMCVVGKIHRHAHLNILVTGACRVVTEFGEDDIEGLKIWTSEPGTKRALVADTDLVWITVHHNPTGTEDPSTIEDYVISKTYKELDKLLESDV